jgi:putative Ca2+/H+ antiporter (TMEM165/GDT1 family)
LLEAFLISTGLVAIGEIGDKTQLLSLVLAARFRKPWPIVAGILAATLANHSMAGGIGAWIAREVGLDIMKKVAGASFLAMALWALVPDKIDESEAMKEVQGGVFWTTVVLFFMAEMGDKTQLATMALAARYPSLVAVIAGTTLGMLLADVPVVFFGDAIARRVPLVVVRRIAAAFFAVLGVLALLD